MIIIYDNSDSRLFLKLTEFDKMTHYSHISSILRSGLKIFILPNDIEQDTNFK